MTAAVARQGPAAEPCASPCTYRPDPASGPPPSCWITRAPQRARLELALAVLRRYGVAALPACGTDPDRTSWQLADELGRRFPEGARSYVIWTAADDERCFDDDGDLIEDLPLHHPPHVATAVAAVLQQVGLAGRRLSEGRTAVARCEATPA